MITIEDALKQINNRFKLIQIAAKRARKLSVYGSHALVDWGNNSPIIVALREIACGYKFDNKGNYVFRDISNLEDENFKEQMNTNVAVSDNIKIDLVSKNSVSDINIFFDKANLVGKGGDFINK
jgi:DNA-directed RNA polymerase omega subunit